MGKIIKDFKNSKVASHSSMHGHNGKLGPGATGLGGFGQNKSYLNVGIKSSSKSAYLNGKTDTNASKRFVNLTPKTGTVPNGIVMSAAYKRKDSAQAKSLPKSAYLNGK